MKWGVKTGTPYMCQAVQAGVWQKAEKNKDWLLPMATE